MPRCLIGVGSNSGNRQFYVNEAIEQLRSDHGMDVRRVSSWHQTNPIGGPEGQPTFLNGAIVMDTTYTPHELLRKLLAIEDQCGRRRIQRWGARTLDLDLLLYGDTVFADESLVIPHPWLAVRRFVLEPAVEIAAELVHPVIGKSIGQLLEYLEKSLPYVAITGLPGSGKRRLINRVLELLPGQSVARVKVAPRQAILHENSAGFDVEDEIELLEHRVERVQRSISSLNEGMLYSDYWIGQSLGYLSSARFGPRVDQHLLPSVIAGQRTVPQRLLIMLDRRVDFLLGESAVNRWANDRASETDYLNLLRGNLISIVKRHCQGPFLILDADDVERVVDDTVAAVRATQS